MSSSTLTQKQWQYKTQGAPKDILKLVDNVPIPTTCKNDEVLVRVGYVALNLLYVHKIMAHFGLLDPLGYWKGKPFVPENEFSGVVCELKGENVTEFKTGMIFYFYFIFLNILLFIY